MKHMITVFWIVSLLMLFSSCGDFFVSGTDNGVGSQSSSSVTSANELENQSDIGNCSARQVENGVEVSCGGTVLDTLVNGSDGSDGNSCSVADNGDGTYTISCEDGSDVSVSDGADGAPGADGADGDSGPQGLAGADGSSCSVADNGDGTYTVSCEDGSSVVLSDGVDGVDGINGVDGADGAAGTDGTSCSASDNGDGTYTISCEDGSSVTLSDGADGADGANGADGADGANGADGADGANGADGADGADGASIEWLGNLATKPVAPTLNQAFYWTRAGMSCVWDGDSWELLSTDGNIPVVTTCENAYTDPRDGQEYEWVKIAGQVWMAENLKYLPSVNTGSDGSEDDAVDAEIAHYYVYGYNGTDVATAKAEANYTVYGVLYNFWATVSTDDPPCPFGWHVPDSTEWYKLAYFIDNDQAPADGRASDNWTTVGDYLKANSALWNTNTGTDDYGFSALPGGYRSTNFTGLNNYGVWWTSSESTTPKPYDRNLFTGNDNLYWSESEYHYAGYLRCVLD